MQTPDNSVPAVPTGAASKPGGEIGLSGFRFFYVVLKWGQERRSLDRVDQGTPEISSSKPGRGFPAHHDVCSTFFLLLYVLLTLGIEALVYLVS